MSAHPSTAAQNHMAPDASVATATVVKQSNTPRLVVSETPSQDPDWTFLLERLADYRLRGPLGCYIGH
jgi:hypothetical protein